MSDNGHNSASPITPDDLKTLEVVRDLAKRTQDPALAGLLRRYVSDRLNEPAQAVECFDIPELPESARIPEELGAAVCAWLDDFILFSRLWSPSSYEGYHEACGIWLLSAIAARRVKTEFGGPRFPALYILLCGRSSIYAKTTVASIAVDVLREIGLGYMLAPDQATPQKFVSLLTSKLPEDYDNLPVHKQEIMRKRLGLAGARGWFHEEFGRHVSSMMQPNGFMADFRGLLLTFADCPPEYTYSTQGRGTEFVDKPYLALLGNLTPANLTKFARKGSELWGDGFMARFATVCPDPDSEMKQGRFPPGERVIPSDIKEPLEQWDKRLGRALVDVAEPDKKDDEQNRDKRLILQPAPVTTLPLSTEAREQHYRYREGLIQLIPKMDNEDLDGNYTRFPEKALRIATLLASLSNATNVELAHYARAQAITERWRRGLHALYYMVNGGRSEARDREEAVLKIVAKLGKPTPTEVSRYVRNMAAAEAKSILDNLVGVGVLCDEKVGRTIRYGFPVES